jgi:hypothetical protein
VRHAVEKTFNVKAILKTSNFKETKHLRCIGQVVSVLDLEPGELGSNLGAHTG